MEHELKNVKIGDVLIPKSPTQTVFARPKLVVENINKNGFITAKAKDGYSSSFHFSSFFAKNYTTQSNINRQKALKLLGLK